MTTAREDKIIVFNYKNYRGEISKRTAKISTIWFGETSYHPTPQWIMTAYDFDKMEQRDFAMQDMSSVESYDADKHEKTEASGR